MPQSPSTEMTAEPVAPGSTIGIVGAGQLARMTALASARLGYRCCVLADDRNSPAAPVAAQVITPMRDELALNRFAEQVAVVTIEWENIPLDGLQTLAAKVCCHPAPEVLAVCQDRIAEKNFLVNQGFLVTRWRQVTDFQSLTSAARELESYPLFLKRSRGGYDGKGQIIINHPDEIHRAWHQLGTGDAILEQAVDYHCEISVIVARSASCAVKVYPVVENIHHEGILSRTIFPGRIEPQSADQAQRLALAVCEQLGVVGLLAVEMFVLKDGQVMINELAPRPHNSGHWTIDACQTSQFEQLVRAICGLPLGDITALADSITMENLLGNHWRRWPELLKQPNLYLHLYGKSQAWDKRKMGHFTRVISRSPSVTST